MNSKMLVSLIEQQEYLNEYQFSMMNLEKELMIKEHFSIVNEDVKIFNESIGNGIKKVIDGIKEAIKKFLAWLDKFIGDLIVHSKRRLNLETKFTARNKVIVSEYKLDNNPLNEFKRTFLLFAQKEANNISHAVKSKNNDEKIEKAKEIKSSLTKQREGMDELLKLNGNHSYGFRQVEPIYMVRVGMENEVKKFRSQVESIVNYIGKCLHELETETRNKDFISDPEAKGSGLVLSTTISNYMLFLQTTTSKILTYVAKWIYEVDMYISAFRYK
jgi:hypothetical protein